MLLLGSLVRGVKLSLQRLDLTRKGLLAGVPDTLAGGRRDRRDIHGRSYDLPVISVSDRSDHRDIGGEDRLYDPLSVERLVV